MWRIIMGIVARAIVTFSGLSGTSRQMRLTTTLMILNIAVLPPQQRAQCPTEAASTGAPPAMVEQVKGITSWDVAPWFVYYQILGAVHALPELLRVGWYLVWCCQGRRQSLSAVARPAFRRDAFKADSSMALGMELSQSECCGLVGSKSELAWPWKRRRSPCSFWTAGEH